METTTTEQTQETPAFTLADCGCWFDCSRGRYIGEAVIEAAISAAWNPVPGGYDGQDADSEYYHEAWDAAENFLSTLAPDGAWFGANESGDWGLWESEPDEQEESDEE